jgi:chemotaxis protein methyltransferase CheR
MLSNQQFDRVRRLALDLAGIELHERHREVLARRSLRFRVSDPIELEALLASAEKGECAATQQLLSLLTTKFTGFFRHPRHFDIAAEHARRKVRECGVARLWSAAAATGEEPYSLAIRLIEAFQCDEPPTSIVASDVDAKALAVARRAEYGEMNLRTLGSARRQRFFNCASAPERWVLAPAVRRLVSFHTVNLTSRSWPLEGRFDAIFCRNVLMYLAPDHRHAILERIASLLAPDGLLVLDPTEHLGKAEQRFSSGNGGIYSLRPTAAAALGRAWVPTNIPL